jgi:glycogen debranching enzyme
MQNGQAVIPRRSGAEVDPLHPHHIVAHEGYTYLHSRMDGTVGQDPEEGLYDYDTRILSWHRMRLAGEKAIGVAAPCMESKRWQAVLSVRSKGPDEIGPALPQDAIELSVDRRVGLGIVERLVVANHSMAPHEADLDIELGADFADLMEVGAARRQHGRIDHQWDGGTRTLTLRYCAEHEGRVVERGLRVRVLDAWGEPIVSRVMPDVPEDEVRYRFVFPLRLEPRARVELRLAFDSWVDGSWRMQVDEHGRPVDEIQRRERERDAIREHRAVLEAPDPFLPSVVDQAADDLLALRNWDLETEPHAWILNAGVPKFTGFFGRDSFVAGMQGAMFGTAPLRGALRRAAQTRGRRVDEFTEEEPGRIVHEMRRGPIADLGIRPHARYYGSHTGPAAFVVALNDLWRWTGDLDFVRRHRNAMEDALSWAAKYGDLDGDGLLEYVRRSPEGLRNQGWKDSGEAIRRADGSIVDGPIATVEEQALHFMALERAAELHAALDDPRAADRCQEAARRLRELVEDRFWMEDEGFYALALDQAGEQVTSITSNPLHLLSCGLAAPDRARRVADRLMEPDMFSGWGIRTLSSDHPSYNPFAYHLGTVWPVENATFVQGARQYGLDEHAEQIITASFIATGHCHRGRLPEVLAGHPREETEFPTTYQNAKSPQAWSASATICLVASTLGLKPVASERRLELVRPRLPPWLAELTVRRLEVGDATVDLRFRREQDGRTTHEVLDEHGPIRVVLIDGYLPDQAPTPLETHSRPAA